MRKYHNTLSQLDKMRRIGHGTSREAYYARKSKLVFKVPYDESCNSQSENEERLFNSLPEPYKKLFPVVGFTKFQGKKVVIMRKVQTLYDFLGEINYETEDFEDIHTVLRICEELNISRSSGFLFYRFVRKFGIGDLYEKNIGIYNGNLVIIDAGYTK